ncbi:unnamed protein product [Orchesella dallaii]
MRELSLVGKVGIGGSGGDAESSGVGSSASGGANSTNSSAASPAGSSLSQPPQNEDYEHVYCQLDPYFNPPLSLTKSQPIVSTGISSVVGGGVGRFSARASIRSWGRSNLNGSSMMETKESGIIPFLQQALAIRYREMLETYLESPSWYRQHMGTTELDEVTPVVFQILPSEKSSSIYGTNGSSSGGGGGGSTAAAMARKRSLLMMSSTGSIDRRGPLWSHHQQPENLRPILPHQIFSKTSEEDICRCFWLEGESGSGKTLLCLKLVQEWIAYNTYNYTSSPLNSRLGEFQVLFYVPLREVRGGSLGRFLLRELIPKRSVLSRMKVANVWKCLNLLGNSMLLILDGLDSVTDPELMKEIEDLLNGHLFPQSMVLLTSTSSRLPSKLASSVFSNNNNESSATMSKSRLHFGMAGGGETMRRYIVRGMDWTQIQCGIRRYFKGRKSGNETRMSEILGEREEVCGLASNPFLCLLLCSVFEEVGDMPQTNAELYTALIKSLIYQNGLLRNDSSSSTSSCSHNNGSSPGSASTSSPSSSCKDNSLPQKYQKMLQDLGKLCLAKLSEKRVGFTEAEITEYCGSPTELIKSGILSKQKWFFRKGSKKGIQHLKLLHPSLTAYLAAYYLAVTVNYPNILRRELELLPSLGVLQETHVRVPRACCYSANDQDSPFLVLTHLMELLQNKSASVFLTMNLLDISVNYLLALLRAAGFYESNMRAICGIMRSCKNVTINVSSEWVSEWKQVLASVHCPVESLEVILRPGFSLSRLTEGLCVNETISSVRFSSVPGSDWTPVEINLICGQLVRLLTEKKLKSLEISMTCLEDKEHSRFQPVVDALCYALAKMIPLKKLVLDMDLTCSQVIQLVSFIKVHDHLEVLHVPHLGCGPEGFRAIANLLRSKPLLSLSLAGSWRSNSLEEEAEIILEPFPLIAAPSFLMPGGGVGGSGMGKPGGFSSLPRGGNGSIKSPSIRRKKGHHYNNSTGNNSVNGGSANNTNGSNGLTENDKRNSDSVLFQRNFLPLPICDRENHEVDGFHEIFTVLRTPGIPASNNLRSLNLSKCVMNWEDVICLGETIRKTNSLDSLRMEGMKLCDVLPVLLGLQENRSLKMLDLSSPHVVIGDDALQLAANSLSKNTSLRLLSLQGWTVYIEEERSMDSLESLFRSTNLQDLDLTGVRVHMSSGTASGTGTTKSQKLNTFPGMILSSNEPSKDLSAAGDNNKKKGKESKVKQQDEILTKKSSTLSSALSLAFGPKRLAPELSFLRLGGMQLEQRKHALWKSTEILCNILPLLDKGKLTHVDISLDRMTAMDAAHPASGGQLPLDEKGVAKMFKIMATQVPRLQSLVMQHWRIKLTEKNAKDFAKSLATLGNLSEINLDNAAVTNEGSKRIDHLVIQSLLIHCKGVNEISWTNFDSSQLTQLAKIVNDNHQGGRLSLKLDGIPLPSIKEMVAYSRSLGNCQIEYAGNQIVTVHKTKDRGEHLIQRLRRFL